MDEEVLSNDIRKFLRRVGVTAQQQIEAAVREAVQAGRLQGTDELLAKMVLTIDQLNLRHEIEAPLKLR